MSLTEEGAKKLAEMKVLARRQHNRLSVLPDSVTMEDYKESAQQEEFLQLPYRPLMDIRSFNDPTVVMDLVFGEIGRGLAFSEIRFLAEHLAKSTENSKI